MQSLLVRSVFLVAASVIVTAVATTGLEAGGGGGGGVSSCRGVEREGDGLSVAVSQSCFSPIVLHVEPGATVKWSNADRMPHNVAAMGEEWGDGRAMAGGSSVSMTFAEAGIFPYYCAFHPGMVGVIAVGGEPGTGAARRSAEPTMSTSDQPGGTFGSKTNSGLAGPTTAGVAFVVGVVGGGSWFALRRRGGGV